MNAETVLITGATSGIGLELAKCFAADRSDLVLVGRREERLISLAADLGSRFGINIRPVVKDLALPGAPQEIFDDLNRNGVNVDVLVNNAGIGKRGTVAGLGVDHQLAVVQINVTALTHLTLLFLPGMIARNRGGILNVASTAAFQPGPNMAVYYSSKAFVLSFTEALAEEVRKTKVTVSCLAPGATDTEFVAKSDMENSLLFRLGAMTAEAVASAGHRGFRAGRVLVIPGLKNKIGAFSVRLAPRFLVRKVTKLLST